MSTMNNKPSNDEQKNVPVCHQENKSQATLDPEEIDSSSHKQLSQEDNQNSHDKDQNEPQPQKEKR